MELLYKPDWEQAKANFRAWWAHEYIGRCAISVTAPKSGVPVEEPPLLPQKVEDRWLDFNYLVQANSYRMRHTYYGAEAFPAWHPGAPGHDSHAAYLGCVVTLNERTGWRTPIIEGGELTDHDYRDLKLDKDGSAWQFGHQVRELAVKESRGKSIPSNMAFGGCGDTLASLRTSYKLLLDVMDYPDYVAEFELYLMKQWIEIYQRSYDITSATAEGSTCWFNLWSPGKFYATQCDFAYMISPQTFTNVFLPAIEMQTRYLDHAIHHVDGPGNFVHVDALLELPHLQAIQILPGAGKPSALHYMDTLKKVQAKEKNLWISLRPNEIETALSELSARGLFITTRCKTEEHAKKLIESCEKWSRDKG